jgi:hypothetical protein
VTNKWQWVLEGSYSQQEEAVAQRIRHWARRDNLVALRRKGRWYFATYNNVLNSPEDGLTDDEALVYLNGE